MLTSLAPESTRRRSCNDPRAAPLTTGAASSPGAEEKMPRSKGNTRGPVWKGPPGLTARQKKNLRERERRDRKGNDPAWLAAEKARSAEKTRRATDASWRERTRPRRGSEKAAALISSDRLTVLSAKQIDTPRLAWMDTNGRLHREQELSAQELIAAWQREQTRLKKAGLPVTYMKEKTP